MLVEPTRDPEGVEIEYLKRLEAIQGRNVLEIGCGNGRLTWRYAGFAASIAAIDPDPARLAETQANKSQYPEIPVGFYQADAQQLPFPNNTFDTAIFAWSL